MERIFSIALCLVALSLSGQNQLTLQQAVAEQNSTFGPERIPDLQWVEGSDVYSYTKNLYGEDWIMMVNAETGDEVEVINLRLLNDLMSQTKYLSLPALPEIQWKDPSTFYFYHIRGYWEYSIQKRSLERVSQHADGAANVDYHPKSRNIAYTIGNNLYVATPDEIKIEITNFGEDTVSGQAIHRFEFGISKGTFWSPNGDKLAFYQKDESDVLSYTNKVYEYAPAPDIPFKYPMAGSNSEKAGVGVFDIESRKTIYLENNYEPDHYWTNVTWHPDGKMLSVAELNRDQNRMDLNNYNAENGKRTATIISEGSQAYVEPETPAFYLGDGSGELLWFSESDGYRHIYHFDADGNLIDQITFGAFEILEISHYNKVSRDLILWGTARAVDRVAYKINLDEKKLIRLTAENGTHIPKVSTTGNYILNRHSSLSTPARYSLLNKEGKELRVLMESKNPLEGYNVGTTEIFQIDGMDDFRYWCRMIKPSDFDPKKKYPVLIYVYGGPHVQLVRDTWLANSSLWMQYMAERGYIIFTLDNRGSANNGIAFEQRTFGGLGLFEHQDQMIGVDYLKSLSYVDSTKMAVHGWSFGGHMTISMLLKNPNTFKVGVAGGPVIDWSMYEVMYTERYMDTPEKNPRGYEGTKLSNYANSLNDDLLIIHGTSDDIVVMQHSMLFLNACINMGKQVDFFPYPGHGHNVRGQDRVHLMKKVLNYIDDKINSD